jgi:hypothetical protein
VKAFLGCSLAPSHRSAVTAQLGHTSTCLLLLLLWLLLLLLLLLQSLAFKLRLVSLLRLCAWAS